MDSDQPICPQRHKPYLQTHRQAVTIPERNVNEMDMVELQRLLQDLDSEDDAIEDESMYSLHSVIGESNANHVRSFIFNRVSAFVS